MNSTPKHWRHFVLPLVLFLFGFAQAGATAHAMRYGAGQHQHNGKVCVLSVAIHKDSPMAVLPDTPDTSRPPLRFEISFAYGSELAGFSAQKADIASQARSPPA